VASFYAHFDIVLEGETPPPPVTVRVCDGLTCEMMGAKALLNDLKALEDGHFRVVRAPCMGRCHKAPVAGVGHHHVGCAGVGSVKAALDEGRTGPDIPPYIDYEAYVGDGGYRLLRECFDGARTPDELLSTMGTAGLCGLGGAGFPAGTKWEFVLKEPGPGCWWPPAWWRRRMLTFT
jgi:formate dehydrogenase